jgi:hypothetical protein
MKTLQFALCKLIQVRSRMVIRYKLRPQTKGAGLCAIPSMGRGSKGLMDVANLYRSFKPLPAIAQSIAALPWRGNGNSWCLSVLVYFIIQNYLLVTKHIGKSIIIINIH